MSIIEFIQDLVARGVSLRLEGERIIMSPASILSADDLAIMRKIKPEVILLLKKQPAQRMPITRTDVEAAYPEILTLPDGRMVRLADVLDQAIPEDFADLINSEVMHAFASSLLMTSLAVWEVSP